MRILTADQMREVDRRAIEEIGVASLVLMENAATGAADAIAERFPEAASAAIFCGPGNNGGDGLALARLLDVRGYRVSTFLVLRSSPPRGDALVQLEILQRLGLPVEEVRPEADLGALRASCDDADLLVDALFGTGLSRPLEGHFAELVRWFASASHRRPLIALDLPSGLDGSRAETPGPHARAQLTVTFAAPKVAHVFAPAAEAVGEVVVTDLGIPGWMVDEAPGGALHLLTDRELAACLAPRVAESHKGTYGHALIAGGAPGKSGAVVLAAKAAVRGGAGLVTAAVPEPLLATVDAGSLESMTLALPCSDDGTLKSAAVPALLSAAEGKQSVGLGPGLGNSAVTAEAVREAAAALGAVPLVLDADGLNAYAGRLAELGRRPGPTILTPHPGEMAQLLSITTAEVQADRLSAVRRVARDADSVVVLKGYQTLVADPDGEVHVNPTGNPGMASGGSGDVLTGLVTALAAQGYDALVAAQLGVYLHGLAGDLALERSAPEALSAGDVLDALPRAFAALGAA